MNQDKEELETLRLAATRAALDVDRRGWRGDILISGIVELLATQGRMSLRQLVAATNQMWGTQSVSSALVEDALSTAQAAHLVGQEGDETWSATDAARLEADADRFWVDEALRSVEEEFQARLQDCCEVEIRADRLPRLFHQLLVALAAGAEGVYEAVADSVDPNKLRPVRFDMSRIAETIRTNVDPRPVARAMLDVVTAAADPYDDFGNQLIRLLIVGNILHGLITRRDVPEQPSIAGTRIALDTSTLVYAVIDDSAARQVFDAVVDESRKAGVEVIVAEHTLEEWDRLWSAADEELGGRENQLRLSKGAFLFVQNPFLKAFFEKREEDQRFNWPRFQVGKRNIRPFLESRGILVRPHGNNRPQDEDIVEVVRRRLLEISADARFRGHRTALSAEADAHSCAMVARWRERVREGLPGAWFIAIDVLTGKVYSEVRRRDRYPLTVMPETWLLFLGTLLTEDPTKLSRLAIAVSDLTASRAFLSVATGYTVDEAVALSRMLAENDTLSREDLRAAIAYDFIALLEESDQDMESEALRQSRAAEVIRKRSARRDERAKRERRIAERMQEAATKEVASAQAELEAARSQARQQATTGQDERARLDARIRKQNRLIVALTCSLLAALIFVYMLGAGMLDSWKLLPSVAILISVWATALRYWLSPQSNGWDLVLAGITDVTWAAIAIAINSPGR